MGALSGWACWGSAGRAAWGWDAIGVRRPVVLAASFVGWWGRPPRAAWAFLVWGAGGVGVARCRGLGQCALVAPAWCGRLLVAGSGSWVGWL